MAMRWNLIGHPENVSVVDWDPKWWVINGKLSSARINCPRSVDQLYAFHTYKDDGKDAISRRWALKIKGLPANSSGTTRTVQAMLFASDDASLDGSTFGEASVWEHVIAARSNSILLEVDFTKVRSQPHSFGLHIQITHDVFVDTAVASASVDEVLEE